MKLIRWTVFSCLIVCGLLARPARAELHADQILLVVNENSLDGMKLAATYQQLRQIPDGRLFKLSLLNADEMSFDAYERNVVPPIRKFLIEHHLNQQVKCIVTFYGVPYRIRARENSPDEIRELADYQDEQKKVMSDMASAVAATEKAATALDPTFTPADKGDLNGLSQRAAAALADLDAHRRNLPVTSEPREQCTAQEIKFMTMLIGSAAVDAHFGTGVPGTRDSAKLEELGWRRYEPEARRQFVDLLHESHGLLGTARGLESVVGYLQTKQSGAATDNELALLWWGFYPRVGPEANALNFRSHGQAPPTMMVMRLDGPTPQVVAKLMQTCIDVEQTGLSGGLALDAQGMHPTGNPDAYAVYDEHVRHLGQILQKSTDLKVTLDDKPTPIPPGSVKDVALYCGWHDPGHYVPGMIFNPGAVGYQVSSFEMVDLHGPNSTQWVPQLLKDGVVGTLGPCAEPYLTAFPLPDDFFPLLLTGKLTLAEVYWKINPYTSWMMSCIGDPLYTPYKVHPAMKLEDLTPEQRAIFAPTQPPPAGGNPN